MAKKAAGRAKHTRLTYKCTIITKRCTVSNKHPHIGPKGSTVEMKATIPEATIKFTNGSPFDKSTYTIKKGKPITATVNKSGSKEYPYSLDCTCKDRTKFAAPPSMIVP